MAPTFSSIRSQFFPPKPQFTERDLPDLKGKVYIVSGANTGVGKELSRLLYSKNAKVYVAARSEEKSNKAIEDIKKAHPASSGQLAFLPLDLSDLTTIKPSVERFLAAENKLHVLFNNAGVMASSSEKAKTPQGYEIQLGVNCVGTFLLTKLLTPTLATTAKSEPPSTVRVIWLSSFSTEMFAEKDVAFQVDNLDYHTEKSHLYKYGISKTGNWAYGVEYAKRFKEAGIVSVSLNPGNLRSELFRSQPFAFKLMNTMMLYPVINGAYTELYAGLSPEITIDKSGSYVLPFGRLGEIRADLLQATKSEQEGGNGGTHKFWDWSEQQVRPYL